jgi:hypothetical protein
MSKYLYDDEMNDVQIRSSKYALELRTANSTILIAPENIDKFIEKVRIAQTHIKLRVEDDRRFMKGLN